MVNELWVQPHPFVATLTNDNLFQDGRRVVLRPDVLREPLAYPPPAVPTFLQRSSRESVRRQDLPCGKRLPPPTFRLTTYLLAGKPYSVFDLVYHVRGERRIWER